MFKKFKLLLLILGVSGFSMLAFNSVAFAEDDNPLGCSGVISGTTSAMFTLVPDEGKIDFDCHTQKSGEANCTSDTGINVNSSPDLKAICTKFNLCYAPERPLAACIAPAAVSAPAPIVEPVSSVVDQDSKEFLFKGWAWNDNLGFISFYCDSSGQNLGVECGKFPYEVRILPAGKKLDSDGINLVDGTPGKRALTGYAWSSIFGYISFSGSSTDKSFDYGVVASPVDGNQNFWEIQTTGKTPNNFPYAYSNVGSWINFDGINFTLPGTDPVCVEKAQCCPAGDATCCEKEDCKKTVEDPVCGDFFKNPEAKDRCQDHGGTSKEVNGGYLCNCNQIPLYCRLADKACLQVTVDADTGGEKPVANGKQGYNIYLLLRDAVDKPITSPDGISVNFIRNGTPSKLSWVDTVKADQRANPPEAEFNFNKDQNPIKKGGGVNFKPITVDNPNYIDKFTVEGAGEFGRFNLGKITSYAPTSEGNVSLTEEISPLSPAPMQWQNEFFIEDPYDGFTAPDKNQLILKSVYVTVDGVEQKVSPSEGGAVVLTFSPAIAFEKLSQVILDGGEIVERKDSITGAKDIPIDFYTKLFKKDGEGFSPIDISLNMIFPKRLTDTPGCTPEKMDIEGSVAGKNPGPFPADDEDGTLINSLVFDSNNLAGLISGVKFKATPRFNKGESNCEFNKKAGVYTTVDYKVEVGGVKKEIGYYSNKVPKTFVSVAVPSINILGNARVQAAAVVNDAALKISAVGGQAVFRPEKGNVVANIASYGNFGVTGSVGKDQCTISSGMTVVCSSNNYSTKKSSKNETILYFKNADVTVNLGNADGSDGNYKGKYVWIVNGGNMIINSDVYNPKSSDNQTGVANQIAVAVLSANPGKDGNGNMYIDCTVRNTQFTAYLDNALFQSFMNNPVPSNSSSGAPDDAQLYLNQLMNPANSCAQWRHDGAFMSYNTIGMADKSIGRGYNPVASQIDARLYDFNYERVIFATFDTDESGNVRDLSCGKLFTYDDFVKSKKNELICYPADQNFGPVDKICLPGCPSGECKCNGIDGSKVYHKDTNVEGDLLIPPEESKRARGLKNEYSPANIFQGQNDSTLFQGITTKTK